MVNDILFLGNNIRIFAFVDSFFLIKVANKRKSEQKIKIEQTQKSYMLTTYNVSHSQCNTLLSYSSTQ